MNWPVIDNYRYLQSKNQDFHIYITAAWENNLKSVWGRISERKKKDKKGNIYNKKKK